jgi:hypothetical protein
MEWVFCGVELFQVSDKVFHVEHCTGYIVRTFVDFVLTFIYIYSQIDASSINFIAV